MSENRIRPRVEDRIGILNPFGQLWTDDTFDTPEAAEKHLRDFWAKRNDFDISRFSYVPVVVTVSVVEFPSQQAEGKAFPVKP